MKGRYGEFGGQYVPEVLMQELINIAEHYEKIKDDPNFISEYQ